MVGEVEEYDVDKICDDQHQQYEGRGGSIPIGYIESAGVDEI